MTQAAPLKLRLFLEGIEVPCVAAQVNSQGGAAATASIQIVPTDSSLLLLPRTHVYLCFLDTKVNPADVDTAEDSVASNVRLGGDDIPDARYKTLFEGEIIGYQYNKTPGQRSLVLQCMDLSSYWDTAYQWFADFSVNGNALTDRTHHFVGAGEYLFNNITSGTRWVLGNILSSKPENPRYAGTKGLLAGYIHLLESIGGVRPRGTTYAGFRGVNDFFSVAELRYSLTGMIGAVAEDTTSARFYRARAFRNWLRSGMTSAGSLISYRDVLRLVGQYIFHNTYPNTCPYYSPGNGTETIRTFDQIEQSAIGKKATEEIRDAYDGIEQAISGYQGISDGNNELDYDSGKTLLSDADGAIVRALALIGSSPSADANDVRVRALSALSELRQLTSRLNSSASIRDEQRRVERLSTQEATRIVGNLRSINISLDGILSAKITRRTSGEITVQASDFLFNQLILPETFFVSPPRCNVIFPDQHYQFTYSRNFLREVSRLSCHGGLGIIAGSGRLSKVLGRYYFAPNIRDVNDKIARSLVYSSAGTIMPHEVHSGIIPKFEHVSHGHRWGLQASKEAGETVRERKISYIQRLANFQFFMHRWSARTMSVTGKFMPNLVLGLPSVVMDKGTASAPALIAISDALGTGLSIFPTAYMGKISQLTHSINQEGAVTQVGFQFARTHRGFDDEFLGVVQRENKDLVDESLTLNFTTLAEAVGSGDPPNDELKKVAQLYFSDSLKEENKLDPVTTIDTIETPESADGTTTIDLFLARQLGITQRTFNLYTERGNGSVNLDTGNVDAIVPNYLTVNVKRKTGAGRFVRQEGAPSPELLLKPGWYDSVWNPVKRNDAGDVESYPISEKVYQPLLGAFAITDDEFLANATEFANLLKFATEHLGEGRSVSIEETSSGAQVLKIGETTVASFDVKTGSIEQAIDGLTILYGLMRNGDLPIHDFVENYVFRPIASLPNVLGESDLNYDDSGQIVDRPDGSTPLEGFHSRAFGPYNVNVEYTAEAASGEGKPTAGDGAFRLLLDGGSNQVAAYRSSIVNKAKNSLPAIPLHLDPRGRAQQRVLAYAAELKINRGLVGA